MATPSPRRVASPKTPAKPQPKGILKKTTAAPPPPPRAAKPAPSPAPAPPADAERQRAQQEAERARLRLLQQLRDTQLKPPVPLETFELLSQFPRSHDDDAGEQQQQQQQQQQKQKRPPRPASDPHPRDVADFLAALQDFQPSEYLDLIEERNCLGKCGYTLCGRPRRALAGQYKITGVGLAGGRSGSGSGSGGGGGGGGGGSGIARTADLNKWCSDECALRALHLKVQLDNPSYVRREEDGKIVIKLELREESQVQTTRKQTKTHDKTGPDKRAGSNTDAGQKGVKAPPAAVNGDERKQEKGQEQGLAQAMAQLEIDKQQQARRDASVLAAERGDAGILAMAGHTKVEVTIREKTTDEPAQPPSADKDSHLMVEGYKTTFGIDKKGQDDDSDDDDFFTIRL